MGAAREITREIDLLRTLAIARELLALAHDRKRLRRPTARRRTAKSRAKLAQCRRSQFKLARHTPQEGSGGRAHLISRQGVVRVGVLGHEQDQHELHRQRGEERRSLALALEAPAPVRRSRRRRASVAAPKSHTMKKIGRAKKSFSNAPG